VGGGGRQRERGNERRDGGGLGGRVGRVLVRERTLERMRTLKRMTTLKRMRKCSHSKENA
jgi:hypothetical protein